VYGPWGMAEFPTTDVAIEGKNLGNRACPVCGIGQFAELQEPFSLRPIDGQSPQPTTARVCVHCGFVAMHVNTYLQAIPEH
jgi:ribosomal protein S27AE